jgi:hypothetical protein
LDVYLGIAKCGDLPLARQQSTSLTAQRFVIGSGLSSATVPIPAPVKSAMREITTCHRASDLVTASTNMRYKVHLPDR